MTDKRAEQRLRSRGNIRIVSDDAQPIDARLLDTSPSGLGLDAESALESGTPIRLHCCDLVIAEGVVQHCRPEGNRFLIGVSLLPPI